MTVVEARVWLVPPMVTLSLRSGRQGGPSCWADAWLRSASIGTKSSLGDFSQGQHDIEGATLPPGTLGPDAPPMCLHQLPGEIQSNAKATNGGPIDRGRRIEALKKSRQFKGI